MKSWETSYMLSYGLRLMGAGNGSKCLNFYVKILKNMLKICFYKNYR